MARLWAPWRSKYIQSVPDEAEQRRADACIFCDYPREPADKHAQRYLLSVGEHALVILNRYPYNPGHLMVVPRAHVATPSELGEPSFRVLAECLRRVSWAMQQVLSPDGLNVGMNIGRAGGAGIADHCHYHVVPRWSGDTNFMPVVGETRVMSVSLEECYAQLLPAVGELVPAVEAEQRSAGGQP
ncbi:MAG: HIT domain-containing protein [Myxococcales bacterium]|nr:HIT domain-containing protein [Myxococcales bacterium]